MEEQQNTNMNNWLDIEANNFNNQAAYEKLPSLKIETGKLYELDIDFSQPFVKLPSKFDEKRTNALIKCTYQGQLCTWWLNTANPLYKQIILKGKAGQTKFKVTASGKGKEAKYMLLE